MRPGLNVCTKATEPSVSNRRLILTSNQMTSVCEFNQLSTYKLSSLQMSVTSSSTQINKSFSLNPLQPIQLISSPPLDLFSPSNLLLWYIEQLLHEYPNHTVCLTHDSKSKNREAYAYSIDEWIVSHRIRNIASVFTTEFMAIFSCLSHLSHFPLNNKIPLRDSLPSLYLKIDPYSTNPLIQRIQSTFTTNNWLNNSITLIWIPEHVINFSLHNDVHSATKQATFFAKKTGTPQIFASNHENYYRSLILKTRNFLWGNQGGNNLVPMKKENTQTSVIF